MTTQTSMADLIAAAKRIAALDAELTREIEAIRELLGSKPAAVKPVKVKAAAKKGRKPKAAAPSPEPVAPESENGHATNGHVPTNRVLLVPKRRGRPPEPLSDSVRAGSVGDRIYDMLAQHGPKSPARLSELLGVTEDSVRRSIGHNKDKFADHLDGKGCVCLRSDA